MKAFQTGIISYKVDFPGQKVTVTGVVTPEAVYHHVARTGKITVVVPPPPPPPPLPEPEPKVEPPKAQAPPEAAKEEQKDAPPPKEEKKEEAPKEETKEPPKEEPKEVIASLCTHTSRLCEKSDNSCIYNLRLANLVLRSISDTF